MNVKPACEYVELRDEDGTEHTCDATAHWVVMNKTLGFAQYRCSAHEAVKEPGCTYSVFPAKDYTRPQEMPSREIELAPIPEDLKMLEYQAQEIGNLIRHLQYTHGIDERMTRERISRFIGEMNRSHRLGDWFLEDLDEIYEQAERIMKAKKSPYPLGFQAVMLQACIGLGQVRLERLKHELQGRVEEG